jgi:anthranilate phosphoribosyltransferase
MKAYGEAVAKLLQGRHLSADEAEATMAEIMDGLLDPMRIAALLTALAIKGETADELAGLARAMRSRAVAVRAEPGVLDTCGTGGSGLDKPNTSSLAALVLAAAGVGVAKHGNRSNTGRCGSADVFERAGVPIELGPEAAERLLASERLAFLFAPRYHPAMKHAAPVRKALGFRTTFNFLGPLANPAGVRRQVLGVSDPGRAKLLAEALLRLGVDRALVLSAEDGLDEISLEVPTRFFWLENEELREERFEPESVGLRRTAIDTGGLSGVELFRAILEGRAARPLSDMVAVNAAAGFMVAGKVERLADGIELAAETLQSGRALEKLESFRAAAIAEANR